MEKSNLREKAIWIIIIAVVIAIVVIRPVVSNRNVAKTFETAVFAANEQNYMEAAQLFAEIKDVRREEIREFAEELISKLCSAQEYEQAKSWLWKADSYELITSYRCNQLSSEISYCEAANLVDNQEYIDAYEEYLRLKDFKDSAQKAEEIFEKHKDVFYEKAIEHYETGTPSRIESAQSIFEQLGAYQESVGYLEKIEQLKKTPEYCYSKLTFDQKVHIWDRLNKYNGNDVEGFWKKLKESII